MGSGRHREAAGRWQMDQSLCGQLSSDRGDPLLGRFDVAQANDPLLFDLSPQCLGVRTGELLVNFDNQLSAGASEREK